MHLTPEGAARLREAQRTHHDCVRERLFAGLRPADVKRLAAIYRRMPAAISGRPGWALKVG